MRRSRRLLLTVAGITATAAAAAGIAYATIPGPDGVVHGCYSKTGSLRVVDTSVDSCKANETPLDWNVTGPAGPQGPQGLQGPAGAQGAQGPPGPAAAPHAYEGEAYGISVAQTPGSTTVDAVQNLPAGTYAVVAHAYLQEFAVPDTTPAPVVDCQLVGTSAYSQATVVLPMHEISPGLANADGEVSLDGVATLNAVGTVSLSCSSSDGDTDGLYSTLVLVPTDGVTVSVFQ